MLSHTLSCSALVVASSSALAGGDAMSSIVASADGEVQFSGALGFEAFDANPSIQTSRSGPSNVRHGVYEFSLASLPDGAIVTGATLRLQTAALISNTGPLAEVFFYAWGGDGAVTVEDHGDQAMPFGTLVAAEMYGTGGAGVPNGSVLDIPFDDLGALQGALDDDDGFLTVRSETINFVTFRVDSLETADSAALRPTLVVTYVPAPATLGVLAGCAIITGRRRR